MRSIGILALLLMLSGSFLYTGCKQAEEVVEKSEEMHEEAKEKFEDTISDKMAPEVWNLVHTEDYKLKWKTWPDKKNIYVNPIGYEAIEKNEAEFPMGTIIVREKYSGEENLEKVTITYKDSTEEGSNGWFSADYAPDGEVIKVDKNPFNITP